MVPRVEHPPRPPSPQRLLSNSKASFQSPTPSSEADDEDSVSDQSNMEPDPEAPTHTRAPQYPGEDTRLTSKKELFGWYSYGWAAEVFVVCGVGSFIPITLEQLARERGVLLSDGVTPCGSSSGRRSRDAKTPAAIVGALIRNAAARPDKGQCVIHLFGLTINTASFAMYTFSISVLVQALLIISMSGAADHGRYRKKLLLAFAFVGSIATMLFLPVVPKVYLIGALLGIISNTCFGASFVLLNSFLPLLVRHHPDTNIIADIYSSSEHSASSDDLASHEIVEDLQNSTTALLPVQPLSSKPSPSSLALQVSTRISSYGIGIGYSAAVLVQVFAVFILYITGQTTFSLRLVLFLVGLWWFVFTLPAALYLRPRPGPPIPGKTSRSWPGYIAYAWSSLYKTFLRARRLKDVVLFLTAWFLLSDGVATVSGTAVLFAKTELAMTPTALAFINVVATLSGVVGAFAWSRFSHYFNLSATQTIVACILLFELIPLYGLLGYIPFIRRLGVLGLQQEWEMYVLGAVYGLVLSGLGAYCRALFGELIPPGSEAAFYALYAITDKGSSIFGLAIVGLITDWTGEIRPAFAFLAVLIAVPLPLMRYVNVDRGRMEGEEMAKALLGERDEVTENGHLDERGEWVEGNL